MFGNKIVVTQQEEAKKEEPQYKRAVFGDITYSGEVLKQVWIINRSLDFRVYEGSIRHTFRETFGAGENGIRLTMVVDGHVTGLKPVYTEKALNYLRKQGVVEVLIKSDAEETLYTLDELYQGLNADASVDAG